MYVIENLTINFNFVSLGKIMIFNEKFE